MRKLPEIYFQKQMGEFVMLQALKAAQLWTVLYDRQYVYCRMIQTTNSPHTLPPRYYKTTFATKGTALAAAARYNKMFETDKFSIAEVDTHYE